MAYQAMLESESEIVGRIQVTGLRSLNLMGILKKTRDGDLEQKR